MSCRSRTTSETDGSSSWNRITGPLRYSSTSRAIMYTHSIPVAGSIQTSVAMPLVKRAQAGAVPIDHGHEIPSDIVEHNPVALRSDHGAVVVRQPVEDDALAPAVLAVVAPELELLAPAEDVLPGPFRLAAPGHARPRAGELPDPRAGVVRGAEAGQQTGAEEKTYEMMPFHGEPVGKQNRRRFSSRLDDLLALLDHFGSGTERQRQILAASRLGISV